MRGEFCLHMVRDKKMRHQGMLMTLTRLDMSVNWPHPGASRRCSRIETVRCARCEHVPISHPTPRPRLLASTSSSQRGRRDVLTEVQCPRRCLSRSRCSAGSEVVPFGGQMPYGDPQLLTEGVTGAQARVKRIGLSEPNHPVEFGGLGCRWSAMGCSPKPSDEPTRHDNVRHESS